MYLLLWFGFLSFKELILHTLVHTMSICKNVLVDFVTSIMSINYCVSIVLQFRSSFLSGAHQDALLDKHAAEDKFGDQELQDTGRPIKSLLVRYFDPVSINLSIGFL